MGSFVDMAGGSAASDCGACPAGTYGDSRGVEACDACPAGFVSRTEGRSSCDPADQTAPTVRDEFPLDTVETDEFQVPHYSVLDRADGR